MARRPPSPRPPIRPADYEALASFRRALRHFLHFSATAAQAAGLSPQQHQALLALKGSPGKFRSVGELAAELDVWHHSAVGLVDRLARRRLVRRMPDPEDRRRVRVLVTAQGEAVIRLMSAAHREELRRIGPDLQRLLRALESRDGGRRP